MKSISLLQLAVLALLVLFTESLYFRNPSAYWPYYQTNNVRYYDYYPYDSTYYPQTQSTVYTTPSGYLYTNPNGFYGNWNGNLGNNGNWNVNTYGYGTGLFNNGNWNVNRGPNSFAVSGSFNI